MSKESRRGELGARATPSSRQDARRRAKAVELGLTARRHQQADGSWSFSTVPILTLDYGGPSSAMQSGIAGLSGRKYTHQGEYWSQVNMGLKYLSTHGGKQLRGWLRGQVYDDLRQESAASRQRICSMTKTRP